MKSLIAIAALLASMSVCAQPLEGEDWWACQSVAAAGLIREDNGWKPATFNHNARFTLIADGDGLLTESAAMALDVLHDVGRVSCEVDGEDIFCISNLVGTSLTFRQDTGRGAIAETLSGAQRANSGTTVSITAFECEVRRNKI